MMHPSFRSNLHDGSIDGHALAEALIRIDRRIQTHREQQLQAQRTSDCPQAVATVEKEAQELSSCRSSGRRS